MPRDIDRAPAEERVRSPVLNDRRDPLQALAAGLHHEPWRAASHVAPDGRTDRHGREEPRPEARLQLGTGVDALHHRSVEPDAGAEREEAVVDAPDVDTAGAEVVRDGKGARRRVDEVARQAEHLGVHVRRAGGQREQRRLAAVQPVDRFVDRAVAAERHEHLVAPAVGSLAGQLATVPLRLGWGLAYLIAALERPAHELPDPPVHERGVRVDDEQDAPAAPAQHDLPSVAMVRRMCCIIEPT